jgi:hypothetical protein
MKIDDEFIKKIKTERELHLVIYNLCALAAAVGEIQTHLGLDDETRTQKEAS